MDPRCDRTDAGRDRAGVADGRSRAVDHAGPASGLSRLELKAPVLDLSIDAPRIVEERESAGTLFPEREDAAETLARLLEKLTARLGPDALSRIERVADHRPERAWRSLRGDVIDAGAGRAKSRATRSMPASLSASASGSTPAVRDRSRRS